MIFSCHGCSVPCFVNDQMRCTNCALTYKPKVDKRKAYNADLMLEAIHFLSKRVPGDPLKVHIALHKFMMEEPST